MANPLKIRLAARCEAAGRSENEDNFQVAADLSVSNAGFATDKIFTLGSKGTLLLVCDGMGGMNAGEVASAIGIDTIKNLFAPSVLTPEVMQSDDTICAYIKKAIVQADANIKAEANKDDAKKGMGSTAVLAWLLGGKAYVGWCGDSRCYRFNPNYGLEQLSHDHSYVQDLVDTGKLNADLAFDHPQKNIITRSLGDPRGAARPDTKVYDLREGDIIMLCSDGLSDSLRDSEIANAMKRGTNSMVECRDALWNDSRTAGWSDNVTVIVAQVVDENAIKVEPPKSQQVESSTIDQRKTETAKGFIRKHRKVIVGFCAILIIAIVGVGVSIFIGSKNENKQKEQYNQLYEKLKKIKVGECKIVSLDVYTEEYQTLKNLGDKLGEQKRSTEVKQHLDSVITEFAEMIYAQNCAQGEEKAKELMNDILSKKEKL